MPFGLPVLPEVYSIKSMSSLSSGSGGHTVDSCSMAFGGGRGGGGGGKNNDLDLSTNAYPRNPPFPSVYPWGPYWFHVLCDA